MPGNNERLEINHFFFSQRFKYQKIINPDSGLSLVPVIGTTDQIERISRWESDEKLMTYYHVNERETWHDEIDTVITILRGNYANFEIVLPSDGSVGLASVEEMDYWKRSASVAILIGEKSLQQHNIASDALTLLFARAKQAGFRRVYATIHVNNEFSARIFKRFPPYYIDVPTAKKPDYIRYRMHLDQWKPPESLQVCVQPLNAEDYS
jgi:RimJ/RimL family protein N-acetyltransferase